MKPRIALFTGDPAGIGPELVDTLLLDESVSQRAQITLIAQQGAIEPRAAVQWHDWAGRSAPAFELSVAGAPRSTMAFCTASVAWPSATPCARLNEMVIAGN